MEISGARLVFLGDSIVEGAGVQDKEKIFWKLLSARDGAETYGNGVGGSRIARQRKASPEPAYDRYLRSRLPGIKEEADVVVICSGLNDYGHGDAPIGEIEDRTDDTFYGALHLLYRDVRQKWPTAKILVMTPIHTEHEHDEVTMYGHRKSECLEDYVRIIQEVASACSLPVLDMYHQCPLDPRDPELKEKYTPDGVHPNEDGNEIMYRIVRQALKEL
jgi:lysophospholipase L1-like esterase